jgi:hypothetical protein
MNLRIRLLAFLLAFFCASAAAAEIPTSGKLAASLRQQVTQCWSPPAGPRDGVPTVVVLDIHFSIDGEVAAQPTLVSRLDREDADVRSAVEQAIKAVYACAPYKLPQTQYNVWRETIIRFDPRDIQ